MPIHDQISAVVQGLPLTGLMADICMSGLDLTRSSVMVRRVLPPIFVSGLVHVHLYKMTYWLWKSHSVRPWLVMLQLVTRASVCASVDDHQIYANT